MLRSMLVTLVVLAFVLNGCAASSHETHPTDSQDQTSIWKPPPPKSENPFLNWCKNNPGTAGTMTGLLVVTGALATGVVFAVAMAALLGSVG